MSNEITLAPGLYQLDLVLDMNMSASEKGKHAGHVSMYAETILVPIMPATVIGGKVSLYFRSRGKSMRLSMGLGGWTKAKGEFVLRD